jgi:hypothetical protein
MNPLAFQLGGWSRRRLIFTGTVLFATQVLLILWLGRRAQPLPQREPFRTRISLAPTGSAATGLEQRIALEDPALFALPALNGFSGPAWLKFPSLDYQPPEYSEPLRWLALNEQGLGETLSQFLATHTISAPLIAAKPLPPLQRYEPNYPNEPVPAESRLRTEGELAARVLPGTPALKAWPHSQILSNTIVQVAVNGEGMTLFTTLLSGSSLAEADDYALKFAGNLRWRPLPRDRIRASPPDPDYGPMEQLEWGKLNFQWFTLPLPATNVASQP